MHKDTILIAIQKALTTLNLRLVRDDPKLLDDGGEIPKSQGRGWRYDYWLRNLLIT